MAIFTIRAHRRYAVCRKVRLGKAQPDGCEPQQDGDGLLIELSLDGARISRAGAFAGFALEEAVVLHIADVAPIEARVRWLGAARSACALPARCTPPRSKT